MRDHTAAVPINNLRLKFLHVAIGIPEAARLLASLFEDDEIRAAALRKFRNSPDVEVSAELLAHVEKWPVKCGLAVPPVQDWWISTPAVHALALRVHGELGDPEEEASKAGLVFPLTLAFPEQIGLPEKLVCECWAWNPTLESKAEYKKRSMGQLGSCLTRHMEQTQAHYRERGLWPVRGTRERKHFEWLVRYQMLGESFQTISDASAEKVSVESIKTTVFELRKRIHLPPQRRRGRPENSSSQSV